MLGVVAAGAITWRFRSSKSNPDCATAVRTATSGEAVLVCQHEYLQTSDPATGIILANALRQSDDLVSADALAKDLVSTRVRGDALQVRGRIALAQNRTDDAVKLLQDARRWHREREKHSDLAIDSQIIAEIHTTRQQYAESLQMLEECIAEARAGADKRTEAICHITSARTFMSAGYFEAAHGELDRATPLLSEDRDLAVLWRWRGNLEQEAVRGPLHHAHLEQAVAALERSLELAIRSKRTTFLVNLHMSLAYALAELERVDEAERHLEEAGLLDARGTYAQQRIQLTARIAYRRKNFSLALSLNEEAYEKSEDRSERLEICVMQARISLARNDLPAAVLWAKRGVDGAEKFRAAQTLSELRPWVLSGRREPFELLFTAYARAAQVKAVVSASHVEDAIAVFDQWQGRTLLDEMARPSRDPSPALSGTATKIQSLGRWLPVVSKAPLMISDGKAAIDTLGKIDLVAFAVAEGELWRLTAAHGRFRLDSLGRFENLSDRVDQFITKPTDPTLAGALGTLILPDDVVRRTTEPLYVVLDASLAALPFVALRRNDQPLIALRPVVRAPRLPVIGSCEPRARARSALVLADAVGDLPDARRESSRIASLFGTTPMVGAEATSTALFRVRSESVLHIAVHAEVDAGGGLLKLYDRAVSAPEISANRIGPPLVVLSACSTARSWDPELAGSLSTAFLAAGSRRVVATLRPVSDTGALEVTSRFYEAGGADDPVRALAQIQAELARSDNKEWPSFAVFGNEVCLPPS